MSWTSSHLEKREKNYEKKYLTYIFDYFFFFIYVFDTIALNLYCTCAYFIQYNTQQL